MSTLISNARILTMDDQLNEFSQADILIRGSKIESIGPNLALPESLT
jgi:dihydroorotase-like cyclic amidohydrolase